MEYKPLFGTVSHTGKTFTMHYHKEANCSGISKQGHSSRVFEGFVGPVIRFDKSNLENVLECIKGNVAEIEEYYECDSPWSRPISLASYLESIQSKGVPVENGYND